MTSTTDVPLTEQRQALREKMQAQRQLIADQLGPAPEANGSYPRSKTMRFLTRRPGMAVALLAEFVALLVGARYVKSLAAVQALARIARSASNARTNGSSAKQAPE